MAVASYELVFHDPDIVRISVPLPANPLRQINAYYIESAGERLLIDTGFNADESFETLSLSLDALGVADWGSLTVLVTHGHPDHSGLLGVLGKAGARILMHKDEYDQIMAPNKRKDNEARLTLEGFDPEAVKEMLDSPLMSGDVSTGPFEAGWIDDGDVIHVGDYDFECVLTPGHAKGHLCLYHEPSGAFLSGDHVLFHISPNIGAKLAGFDSLAAYLSSLKRVRDIPATLVLPGHGMPFAPLKNRVDELLSHHAKRLGECLDVLGSSSARTCLEAAEGLSWSRAWDEFSTDQQAFASSECHAHLDYLVNRGIVDRELRDGTYLYSYDGRPASL